MGFSFYLFLLFLVIFYTITCPSHLISLHPPHSHRPRHKFLLGSFLSIIRGLMCCPSLMCQCFLKYLNLCEVKQKCNQNLTNTWNETCWTYCNYEATPATTDKTWIAFEKCHLANCTNGTVFLKD